MRLDRRGGVIPAMKMVGWGIGGILAAATLAQVQLKPSSWGHTFIIVVLVIFLLVTYIPLLFEIGVPRIWRKKGISDYDYYGDSKSKSTSQFDRFFSFARS